MIIGKTGEPMQLPRSLVAKSNMIAYDLMWFCINKEKEYGP